MKNIIRLLVASALGATISHAAPFLAVGDNAEIFVTGTLGVRSDGNVFLTPSNQDDIIVDINPGVELVFGKSSTVQGKFSFVEKFANYLDHTDLSSNLASTAFNAAYDDGKTKSTFDASFDQLNQNTVDVRPTGAVDALIRRDVYAVNGGGEVSVTDKTKVGAGFKYLDTEYKLAGFSDSETFTIPVNYFYEVTPKVDLSLGYRYRESAQQIGFDTKDHFFNVGARGEFTPKLSGRIAVGLTQRQYSHKAMKKDDGSILGVDSELSYIFSPKTTLQFGVGNDFDTNSQGQQQKNLDIHATATSKLAEEWTLSTAVFYRSIDYYNEGPLNRVDKFLQAQVGATYVASEHLSITGTLAYMKNDSDLASSNFENTVLTVAANLRY